MTAIPPEQVVTLVLSIFCGVLGVFLLTQKSVRMLKGGSCIGSASASRQSASSYP